MLFFFIGLLFIKILFGHIYLLPILIILDQYLSPIPLTKYSIPLIISIIYKQIITLNNLSDIYFTPLLCLIPYGLVFSYAYKPNPIAYNKEVKQYSQYLIFEIFKSSYLLLYQTIKNPILHTNTIILPCPLNKNTTTTLATSFTATPGTYTISAKQGIIILNSIGDFDDSLSKHSFFKNNKKI